MSQFLTLAEQSPGLESLMLGMPGGTKGILPPAFFERPGFHTLHETGPIAPTQSLGNSPVVGFIPVTTDPQDFAPVFVPLRELTL